MSCGNCGTNSSEMTAEAYIQPCTGQSLLFSNVINGDYPAITFTNLKPARKGKKTKVRKKDSKSGNLVVCYTKTDAPGDATVDIEIAPCGCGGYAPRELEDQVFNAFMKYRCCGDLVRTQVITGIDLVDPTTDKLNDFTATLEQKVTYNGSLFNEEYDIYPLKFSEVAASAAVSSAGFRSATYMHPAKNCVGAGCGSGCHDRWLATDDTGKVAYKASAGAGVAAVSIPSYSTVTGSNHVAENNSVVYVTFANASEFGYWYTNLASGVPGTWTKVVLGGGNYTVYGIIASNTGNGATLIAVDSGGTTTFFAIAGGGQYKVESTSGNRVVSIESCGSKYIAGVADGKVMTKGCDGSWSATNVAPSTLPVFAVSLQPGTLNYWAGSSDGVVHKSTDSGYTWSTVGLPSAATAITAIQWANELTGYILLGNQGKVLTTIDGGASWEDASERISGAISASALLTALALPCCDSPTAAANNLLVAGVIGVVGNVWTGTKTSC